MLFANAYTVILEVNYGWLVTNLPVHLTNTTELKQRINCQWQPLQRYMLLSQITLWSKLMESDFRTKAMTEQCYAATAIEVLYVLL